MEPFRDQLGNDYTGTSSGKAVRNWMWTASGRGYVSAFLGHVADALGPDRIADTDGVRLGGGWYGEMHYPQAVSGGPTYAWQGFGQSMQTGTDLADGMDVCPLPGYVPYTGTDDQDCQWLNWYLNGLIRFEQWLITQHKALGFTRNLYLMLPGYGVRTNQARTSAGYKQAAALGEDHIRAVGAIMHDPAVWPYSTWLNTPTASPGVRPTPTRLLGSHCSRRRYFAGRPRTCSGRTPVTSPTRAWTRSSPGRSAAPHTQGASPVSPRRATTSGARRG